VGAAGGWPLHVWLALTVTATLGRVGTCLLCASVPLAVGFCAWLAEPLHSATATLHTQRSSLFRSMWCCLHQKLESCRCDLPPQSNPPREGAMQVLQGCCTTAVPHCCSQHLLKCQMWPSGHPLSSTTATLGSVMGRVGTCQCLLQCLLLCPTHRQSHRGNCDKEMLRYAETGGLRPWAALRQTL
jgi:hypothetical protein